MAELKKVETKTSLTFEFTEEEVADLIETLASAGVRWVGATEEIYRLLHEAMDQPKAG